MLKFILRHGQFLDEGIWVSLSNICFSGLNCCLLAKFIVAIDAGALGPTEATLGEALAVQLEALGAIAVAAVGESHGRQG